MLPGGVGWGRACRVALMTGLWFSFEGSEHDDTTMAVAARHDVLCFSLTAKSELPAT